MLHAWPRASACVGWRHVFAGIAEPVEQSKSGRSSCTRRQARADAILRARTAPTTRAGGHPSRNVARAEYPAPRRCSDDPAPRPSAVHGGDRCRAAHGARGSGRGVSRTRAGGHDAPLVDRAPVRHDRTRQRPSGPGSRRSETAAPRGTTPPQAARRRWWQLDAASSRYRASTSAAGVLAEAVVRPRGGPRLGRDLHGAGRRLPGTTGLLLPTGLTSPWRAGAIGVGLQAPPVRETRRQGTPSARRPSPGALLRGV